MMPTRKVIAGVLIFTVIAALYLTDFKDLFSGLGGLKASSLQPETVEKVDTQTVWFCPMHSEISQHQPGTCPICGMKLVASASAAPSHEHGIEVDNATQQNLGIRRTEVKESVIGQTIRTYGNVIYDETSVFSVRPRYDGWVRKLYVHSVGERVRQGQVLYEIYSPDLIARQRGYLNGLDRKRQILQTLSVPTSEENKFVMDLFQQVAKDRAALVQQEDISIDSLLQMEDTRQVVEVVKIVAQRSGVVTQINVQEGGFVSPASAIMTLSDISKAWIDIALYPDQTARVQTGNPVSILDSGGTIITTHVNFVSTLSENNRAHARASVDLAHTVLKPGAYVDITIQTRPHKGLVLPRSAIIYSAQGNRVMLVRESGHFLPVVVETGVEDGDWVEILDGLKKGAQVAVNGQFLLDSAASMNATAERLHKQQP